MQKRNAGLGINVIIIGGFAGKHFKSFKNITIADIREAVNV